MDVHRCDSPYQGAPLPKPLYPMNDVSIYMLYLYIRFSPPLSFKCIPSFPCFSIPLCLAQAYAKLHGSYDCLLRGSPPYALRDLAGGAPQALAQQSPPKRSLPGVEPRGLHSPLFIPRAGPCYRHVASSSSFVQVQCVQCELCDTLRGPCITTTGGWVRLTDEEMGFRAINALLHGMKAPFIARSCHEAVVLFEYCWYFDSKASRQPF